MADNRSGGGKRDAGKDDKKLQAFRTEYRKLIGTAIIEGLIDPSAALAGFGPAASSNHDQNGGGYTQNGGDYDQYTGDYNQSSIYRGLDVIRVVELDRGTAIPGKSS
jgi:hypothetical protein